MKQELIDFIMRQPPEREVNMFQNESRHSCGCAMVHLGREKGFGNFECSSNAILSKSSGESLWEMDEDIGNIVKNVFWTKVKTYGDIQKEYGNS